MIGLAMAKFWPTRSIATDNRAKRRWHLSLCNRDASRRVPDAARARVRFQGRLIVADRHNHRIQILTKEGKFIAEYDDFGRTSGLAIDKNDVIYTADSESTERVHPGWQRGIRIGSLKDGKVTMFIPPHKTPNSPDGAMGEGIAIDAAGNRLHSGSTTEGRDEIRQELAA